MSNKLKKKSEGYKWADAEIRKRVTEERGINVTPEFMREFTECEDKEKKITQDEFFDILSKMSDDDFEIFKIVKVSKSTESRGMMICPAGTTVAFSSVPIDEEKE